MIKYALKNFSKYILRKPISFVLIEIYMTICVFSLFFCYGVAANYNMLKAETEARAEDKTMVLYFEKEDGSGQIDEITELFNSLDGSVKEQLYCMFASVDFYGNRMGANFTFGNGSLQFPTEYAKNWTQNGFVVQGRFYSEEEFDKGEKVILVPDEASDDAPFTYDRETNICYVGKEEFKVVGTLDEPCYYFPITVLDGKSDVYMLSISFQRVITKTVYNEVIRKAEMIFGDRLGYEEKLFDESENIRFYNKMIKQEIIILLVVIIALLVVLFYLVLVNKNKMNIYKLCGMGGYEICRTFYLQWICMSIPAYLMGMLLFDGLVKDRLAVVYPYIKDCINIKVYLTITIMLFGVMFLIGQAAAYLFIRSRKGEVKRI